jgi:hypothetical protein
MACQRKQASAMAGCPKPAQAHVDAYASVARRSTLQRITLAETMPD